MYIVLMLDYPVTEDSSKERERKREKERESEKVMNLLLLNLSNKICIVYCTCFGLSCNRG